MEGHEALLSTVRDDLWWDESTKVTPAWLITAHPSHRGRDGGMTPRAMFTPTRLEVGFLIPLRCIRCQCLVSNYFLFLPKNSPIARKYFQTEDKGHSLTSAHCIFFSRQPKGRRHFFLPEFWGTVYQLLVNYCASHLQRGAPDSLHLSRSRDAVRENEKVSA